MSYWCIELYVRNRALATSYIHLMCRREKCSSFTHRYLRTILSCPALPVQRRPPRYHFGLDGPGRYPTAKQLAYKFKFRFAYCKWKLLFKYRDLNTTKVPWKRLLHYTGRQKKNWNKMKQNKTNQAKRERRWCPPSLLDTLPWGGMLLHSIKKKC